METKRFVKSLLEVRENCGDLNLPSFVRITTITSLSKLDSDIDIPFIREKFSTTHVGKIGSNKSFEWKMKENGFYNQITLEYADVYSKKSVKVFPNGSVHVTGCCNIKDCKSVMSQLCCIISKIIEKEVHYSEFRVVMINSNFSVNSNLDLMKVISEMKARGCIVSFNPETYSAVKIKFNPGPDTKQVTASIFSSGKVIVTGAVTLREIVFAYQFILSALKVAHMRPTDQRDLFDNFMGFTFEQWKSTVKDVPSFF